MSTPKITFRRARDPASKEVRRKSILLAAAQLITHKTQLAKVDDIAKLAGLAKGTVYLYFTSREEIYLTLLQAQFEAQLDALDQQLAAHPTITPHALAIWLMQQHAAHPVFLPLACMLPDILALQVGAAAVSTFNTMLSEKRHKTGQLLEARLPGLPPGSGEGLLFAMYSLLMGLWQNKPQPAPLDSPLRGDATLHGVADFQSHAIISLQALCEGYPHAATP